MPFPTWLAGQRITAEALNEMMPLRADKTVTTTAGNSTLSVDPEMFLNIPAAGIYRFEAHCFFGPNTDNAADVRVAFTYASGNLNWGGIGSGQTITTATIFAGEWLARTDAATTTVISFGLSPASNTHVLLKGVFRANSAQFFGLQWAQTVTSATLTSLLDGSYMTAQRVA